MAVALSCACQPDDAGEVEDRREPCAQSDPLRRAWFGDLHVHTGFSFDARSYGNRLTPADAYAFARGQPVELAPHAEGMPRTTRIERPLDFMAVTDHGELLGEVAVCNDPASAGYDSTPCAQMRTEAGGGALTFGTELARSAPDRRTDVCGSDPEGCLEPARERWAQVIAAAEDAYDRTPACEFTTFVAYEYSNTRNVTNLHRNVIFESATVPPLPISHYEEPKPMGLLRALDRECRQKPDCNVISIPHNSNLSNGNLFAPLAPDAESEDDEREVARLRRELEPLAEIFQHKGDSECRNGFDPDRNDPDCGFEKLRPTDDPICTDGPDSGGMRLGGCSHPLDFLRNVLEEGLVHERRLGVNPYAFGVIGSTDTHNGTPGHVSSYAFPGHVGTADDTPRERLGPGTLTHDGLINNPGGLAVVWAEDNTRASIFAGLERREAYATSGPRIELRFFGGWERDGLACGAADLIERADAQLVPMGAVLSGAPAGSAGPTFVIQATADPGTLAQPGAMLNRIQIIKGSISESGEVQEKVYAVVEASEPAAADPVTCMPSHGAPSLCAVWTDSEFANADSAFYYARVFEGPTCRWSTPQCNELLALRPEGCTNGTVPPLVEHRAWSSAIWYSP